MQFNSLPVSLNFILGFFPHPPWLRGHVHWPRLAPDLTDYLGNLIDLNLFDESCYRQFATVHLHYAAFAVEPGTEKIFTLVVTRILEIEKFTPQKYPFWSSWNMLGYLFMGQYIVCKVVYLCLM